MGQITSKILFKGLSENEKILSDENIEDILNRSAELLAIDTQGKFTNIKEFNNRLKQIGAIIEKNIQLYTTSKKVYEKKELLRVGYSTTADTKSAVPLEEYNFYKGDMINTIEEQKMQNELKVAIGEAYFLIMKFREKISGEKINYGIYIETGKYGESELVDITEENILYLMNINNNRINLLTSQTLLNNIKEFSKNLEKEEKEKLGFKVQTVKSKVYNDFFHKMVNRKDGFDDENTAGQKKGLYVKFDITYTLKKYEKFKQQFLNKEETKKTGVEHRAAFTRGHFAEAFDIAYDILYKNLKNSKDYDYTKLKYEFFKNLEFDQIAAIAGGDNAVDINNQRSIKSYGNGLYDVSTLYGDIKILTDALDEVLSKSKDKQYIENRIKNLFYTWKKYSKSETKGESIVRKKLNDSLNKIMSNINDTKT